MQVRARLLLAAMFSQLLEHEWQKIRPHKRQWWRRLKSVNWVWQPWQSRTVSSGVHLSWAWTRCKYSSRSLCCQRLSFSLQNIRLYYRIMKVSNNCTYLIKSMTLFLSCKASSRRRSNCEVNSLLLDRTTFNSVCNRSCAALSSFISSTAWENVK